MNGFAILLFRFSHTVGFPVCDSAMYSTPNRTCRETFRSNSFPAAYSSRLRLASEMRSSTYTRSDGGRLSSSRTAFKASSRNSEIVLRSSSAMEIGSDGDLSAMISNACASAASRGTSRCWEVEKPTQYPFPEEFVYDSHSFCHICGMTLFVVPNRLTFILIRLSKHVSASCILLNDVDIPSSNPSSLSSILKNCSMYSAGFIDSSPNCSARTSQMRDDTDFRRGPGGPPNAARHHTRKGGA